MTTPALELGRLSVRYPGATHDALHHVSLTVERGERVALVGPNGSGKTSLLSAVVGLVPFEGAVTVDGIPVERRRLTEVRRRVGFLFSVADDQILFPTVLDDVRFGLRRLGLEHGELDTRAARVLERLGIAELAGASSHHLSLGQRKRVALAGTLVLDPVLLLLDEPSGGLDPRGRVELAAALRGVDGAIVLATHDLDLATRTCTRAVVLRAGQIVEDLALEPSGSPAPLLEAMYPEGLEA